MNGFWGVWLPGGMRGCRGACVVVGGVHRILRDTVNERVVRTLLECILVQTLLSMAPTR